MNAPTTPSLSITWQQPTFILPLYCLCPLLAVSNSLAVAAALSLIILWLTLSSILIITLIRGIVPKQIMVFASICACSTLVATTEMALHAWDYELYRRLGMFLPMSVIACLLMCREEMASPLSRELILRALKINGGFTFAALILGTGREMVGQGTLLHDAGQTFGNAFNNIAITLFPADMGFVMGVLAPGAFIGFGIGVALYNWIWLRRSKNHHAP